MDELTLHIEKNKQDLHEKQVELKVRTDEVTQCIICLLIENSDGLLENQRTRVLSHCLSFLHTIVMMIRELKNRI